MNPPPTPRQMWLFLSTHQLKDEDLSPFRFALRVFFFDEKCEPASLRHRPDRGLRRPGNRRTRFSARPRFVRVGRRQADEIEIDHRRVAAILVGHRSSFLSFSKEKIEFDFSFVLFRADLRHLLLALVFYFESSSVDCQSATTTTVELVKSFLSVRFLNKQNQQISGEEIKQSPGSSCKASEGFPGLGSLCPLP